MKEKRLKITLALAILCQSVFAQEVAPVKKPGLIGFSANLVTFSTSLSGFENADPGFSLMYWKGITNKVDFSIRYNGLISDYSKPFSNSGDAFINELEASLHARAMNNNRTLNPFLTAGIGAGFYNRSTLAPYVPVGAGLQVNMSNMGYIFLQGNYRFGLSKPKLDDNLFLSLGFAETLGHEKREEVKELPAPPTVLIVLDTDNDGVPDSTDACPGLAGVAALQGCPDKDNDGIADKDDKCPDVAGLARYNGCPIPDTDKDGINDEQDKCPDVAGVAKYDGCPIPDTDKDGVNDEMDKCPTLAGTAANDGCPEIKAEIRKRVDVAAKQIFFATGSAKLLTKSNKSLNEIAKVLMEDANLKIDINGHTDNTGKPEKNKLLSENRAKAVNDYLVKKGVSEERLQSAGFGQEQPIADNKKAAGRAKNRRVELNLHYN